MYHMENTPLLLPLNTQRKKIDGWKILSVYGTVQKPCVTPHFLIFCFQKARLSGNCFKVLLRNS